MKRKRSVLRTNKDMNIRTIFLKTFIIIIYSLLGIRLFYLQVYKGEYYHKLSQNNRVKIKTVNAPRGKIYDRNGKLLVTNLPGYKLVYLNGREYDDKILNEISKLVDMPKNSIEKKIKYGEIYTYTGENEILEDLPVERAHIILENLEKYPYLDVVPYSKRNYIYDTFASHTIGYVKPINKKEYEELKDKGYTRNSIVGKQGVEKSYDRELQGKDGLEYIEVNAYNKLVKSIDSVKAIPGKELLLSIDSRLQDQMAKTLEGKKGAFIAMDVKTGEVITIISNPEYSLNRFAGKFTTEEWNSLISDPLKPLYNRTISSSFPPGSIFKVIPAMGFLQNGIDPDMTIYDPGYYQLGKFRYRSWKHGGHGVANMSKSAKGGTEKPGKNVAAKSGLNRAILDQAWSEFRRQLDYKLLWNGGHLIAVPPRNTSRCCPACEHTSKDNRQTQENFECVECGYTENADVVGAINILKRGQEILAAQ